MLQGEAPTVAMTCRSSLTFILLCFFNPCASVGGVPAVAVTPFFVAGLAHNQRPPAASAGWLWDGDVL